MDDWKVQREKCNWRRGKKILFQLFWHSFIFLYFFFFSLLINKNVHIKYFNKNLNFTLIFTKKYFSYLSYTFQLKKKFPIFFLIISKTKKKKKEENDKTRWKFQINLINKNSFFIKFIIYFKIYINIHNKYTFPLYHFTKKKKKNCSIFFFLDDNFENKKKKKTVKLDGNLKLN